VERRPWLVRSATAALAVSLTVGAALRLEHVFRSDELSWHSERLAYLVPALVALGGAAYALASWFDGALWLGIRRIGWALMTAPLLIPSTFTLALPLMAPLALTLGAFPTRRPATRVQRSPGG
jgi:hypothetical protein